MDIFLSLHNQVFNTWIRCVKSWSDDILIWYWKYQRVCKNHTTNSFIDHCINQTNNIHCVSIRHFNYPFGFEPSLRQLVNTRHTIKCNHKTSHQLTLVSNWTGVAFTNWLRDFATFLIWSRTTNTFSLIVVLRTNLGFFSIHVPINLSWRSIFRKLQKNKLGFLFHTENEQITWFGKFVYNSFYLKED